MFWAHARVDRNIFHRVGQRYVARCFDFRASHRAFAGARDTQLLCDGRSRAWMVASDHDYPHACVLCRADRRRSLRTRGIDHADHTQPNKFFLRSRMQRRSLVWRQQSIRESERSQRLIGERVYRILDLATSRVGKQSF